MIEGTKIDLPGGVHDATLAEVLKLYAYQSERRGYLGSLLSELYDYGIRSNAEQLIVAGSFISNSSRPDDLDCALVLSGMASESNTLRWDRENLARLDLRICADSMAVHNWCGLHLLNRGSKLRRPVVRIPLYQTFSIPNDDALEALAREPLASAPRGTFDGVPRVHKVDVVSRLVLAKLEEIKDSQEIPAMALARFLFGVLKSLDRSNSLFPMTLEEMRPEAWPKDEDEFSLRTVDLKGNEGLISALVADELYKLPPTALNQIYINSLDGIGLTAIGKNVRKFISETPID